MLSNIKLLIAACQELNLDYKVIHSTQNIVRVNLTKPCFFVNYSTPFIDQATAKILRDKDYTYHLVKDKIKTPKTKSFLSPFCNPKYREYLKIESIDSIVEEITIEFALPTIVKRNAGSSGINVFFCEGKPKIREALEQIFNVNSKEYDYVALSQEYIEIIKEYRAVFCYNNLHLLYEKDNSNGLFVGNLSPLHWEGAIAKHITDPEIITGIQTFVQPVFQELNIAYGGFDIARDRQGNYWLIEINSHPNYDIFIRDNDPKFAVDVFKTMLQSWEKV
jgi:glutathione synthase/RimK-type ligase-like ATP-grasp enzyme